VVVQTEARYGSDEQARAEAASKEIAATVTVMAASTDVIEGFVIISLSPVI